MKTAKNTTKRAAFVELEPEIIEPRGTRHIQLDEEGRVAKPRSWDHLPVDGPRVLSASFVGSKMTLTPSDQRAARRLEALRGSAGRRYDQLRKEYLPHLDQLLRRGTARIEEISLLATLNGVQIEIPEEEQRAVQRYQDNLARAQRPIPRMVWRDPAPAREQEITGEQSLGRSSGWTRRTDGHRIN